MIRAFIAISPDGDACRRLTGALDGLAGAPRLRRVPAQNLHLTLAFLGQISPVQADSAAAAVQWAAAGAVPFGLQIDGQLLALGARRRIIAAALKGDTGQLDRLWRRVREALSDKGFASDERRFQPHMTLARIQRTASARERRAIWQAAEIRLATLQVEFRVQELGLYRSHLGPSGARYQLLTQSEFGNPDGRITDLDRCP